MTTATAPKKIIKWDKEKLNFPKRVNNLSDLFQDGQGNHAVPLNMRKAIPVVKRGDKAVYSWDDDYLSLFLPNLVENLSGFDSGVDKDRFCISSGFIDKPKTLLTAAGYPMSPMSFLTKDNAKARNDLGLPRKWRSERHRLIFREVCDAVFECWHPTAIRAPSLSTSGFPSFTHDVTYKIGHANYLLDNIDSCLTTFANRDMESLVTNFGVVLAMNGGVRLQVDTVGKKRIAYSLAYAYGMSNTVNYADKTVSIMRYGKLQHYPHIGAMRARFINGAGFSANVYPQMMSSGHMKAIFALYPKTFHHTSIEEVTDDLNTRADCCMTDVSDYDRTIPTFMMDEMYASMATYWEPELVAWFKHLMESAYYTRPLAHDSEEGGWWVGDPLSGKPQVIAGNRSGHGGTSLVAKLVKVGESLTVIDDIVHDVLNNVRSYLCWERPTALKNNGDDEALCGTFDVVNQYRKMRTARGPGGEVLHGYLSVDIEMGAMFSGYYFGRRNGKVYPMRRAVTMLEKLFVPERGVGTVFRRMWPLGFIARMNNGDHMPNHGEVIRIMAETWNRSNVGKSLGPWMSILEDGLRDMPTFDIALTQADIEVLLDPDKMHYKYTDDDISPAVLHEIAGNIAVDNVTDIATRFFKGLILDPNQISEEKVARTTANLLREQDHAAGSRPIVPDLSSTANLTDRRSLQERGFTIV